MRRRFFLHSATSIAALTLVGCGGGGGSSATDTGAATGAATGGSSAGSTGTSTGNTSTVDTSTPSTGTSNGQQAAQVDTGTPTAQASAAAAYPFGARIDKYKAGILPTQSSATMDSLLKNQYTAWKAARVVSANSIVSGGYAIQFSNTTYMTVSEGTGYGMLLAALFAGHDPQAQALFDGLLAVVRARPAYAVVPFDPNGKYLHEWRINADGTSGGEGWSAMDGDLDIAMALLMADRQWGSAGKWNYKQEALNTIAALKSWSMNADGSTRGLPSPKNNRTSDYMIGHFRAFKAATGDSLWDLAVDKAYALLDRMQTVYSPGVGLMPDFVMNTDTSSSQPSTGYIGDGNANEGYFWWNACRNPWRFSADYVLSGDSRFALVTGRMMDFFQKTANGDAANIGMGYALDGTCLMGGNKPGGNSAAYHGPICAGATVDARFQAFLDLMWNWNATHLTTGYYDSEIQLLSLAVASGNWWSTAAKA